MKKLFLTLLLMMTLYPGFAGREVITLRTGWKFSKGPLVNAQMPGFDDSKWQNVEVPHDWAITGPFQPDGDGNTGKLPWKGDGWYRKTVEIPESYRGKIVYLLFDGVMASPEVFVNGSRAGQWDYGYNSFHVDITPFLIYGRSNLIAVHADTRRHDSRWYPGAGIFRKTQMIVTEPVHTGIWGIQVTTPVVSSGYAEVNITSSIITKSGNQDDDILVETAIISPGGKEIARKPGIVRPGQQTAEIRMQFILTAPERWDIGSPALYQAVTVVSNGKGSYDSSSVKFGIRTMRFTADHGFYLNDRRVQFKGANLHHDLGPLGTAFNYRAMERELELLKGMGCNAIRTSHNVPAPELLDLCDQMGFLVFDEIFDKWDEKADYHKENDFNEFAERNVRNFILRDRNHPSIFIWSVGNEMGDIQTDTDGGFKKLETMVGYVRKYDSTRPVTMVCDNRNSAEKRHFDYYDIHAWNYGRRYEPARQMEPSKSVIISESASTVSTRGFYEFPLPAKKTGFTGSMQVSSYDLNAPWWAEIADDDFMWQEEEPYVAGEFVWTGFDYLGEPTPYTNEWAKEHGMSDSAASYGSYFGIFDLCGIPKDRYFLYKSHWRSDDSTVHILPHWNWQGMEEKNIPVFVYTGGDCAELFLNGRSLGKRCKVPGSDSSAERFRLMWTDVPYEPGELRVTAWKEGMVIGQATMQTTGKPARLKLTPDRKTIHADGCDLSYVLIEAIDEQGRPCPLADDQVNMHLSGPGKIAGVGNGNPRSYEPFQASRISLFFGKAMVIIRSGENPGNLRVDAVAKGLKPDFAEIRSE